MAAICGDECKLWGKVERHSCLQSSSSARPLALGVIPTTVGFLGLVERSKLVSYGTELPSEKDMDMLREEGREVVDAARCEHSMYIHAYCDGGLEKNNETTRI